MMAKATVVRVKAATAKESTLQAGETSKVAVNEETTKGRERTAKWEKTKEVGKSQEVFTVLSVKMARFEAKSRGGGYTKEVTRLCSQEKVCLAYRKKGVHVLDPGHWDKPNGKGNHSFLVRVEEKGLVDCSAQCPVGYNLKKSLEKLEHVEESTTASTTRSSFSASPSKECPWMEVEDDAINAVLVGKEFSNSCFMENCTELLMELMEKADHELGKRWAGVVEEIIDKSRVFDHKSNGLEDLGPVQTIGSKFRSSSETNKKIFAVERGDVLPRASLKVATERNEFRGKKRYGSLWDIHDKALTDLERKKKVRACRKNKICKKSLEISELSGRSLSDSDLSSRWDILTKKARKTLKFGKKIGLQIVGNEEEVVEELMNLEFASI
ncbi:hypothetical protein V6N11_057466 [Hibiscus sabdariffa]|uniref:Uncharacterized protein n=1 Tax=Hibiscus sabdariffa TaxID=183260 RepID=A0ABR2NGT6_9ROSI